MQVPMGGVGPGDPSYLTQKGPRLIQEAVYVTTTRRR